MDVASIADRVANARADSKLTLLGEYAVDFDYKSDLVMHRTEALPYHANGMRFSAFDAAGEILDTREFYSVGGGFVVDETAAAEGEAIVEDPTVLPHPFTTAVDWLPVRCRLPQPGGRQARIVSGRAES